MNRGTRRLGWLLTAAVMLIWPTFLTTAAAAAASAPAAVRAPALFADTLSFAVKSISPTIVSATGSSTLTIAGTMTNTLDEPLTDVIARVQRGDALSSPAALKTELAGPSNPEATWSDFVDLNGQIDPGATVAFSISAPLYGALKDTLAVTEPGVYPIMVNVNAKFASAPSQDGARVGEVHLLLTVASVKSPPEAVKVAPAQPNDPAITGTATPVVAGTPQGLNVVLPLVDRPHRDPTGAFFDDGLATSISPGGRLDSVLAAAESASVIPDAATLAVDPGLLEDLHAMSDGYTVGPFVLDLSRGRSAASASGGGASGTTGSTGPAVGDSPASGAPSSSPPNPTDAAGTTGAAGTTDSGAGTASDSTATPATTYVPIPGPSAVPGTGTQSARAFLLRIRTLAAKTPVLVLPYSDTDGVAVVRANLTAFLTDNITRGRAAATAVLGSGAQLITDLAWPLDGLIDLPTLTANRSAGLTATLISLDGLATPPTANTALLRTTSGTVDAIVADSTLPAGAAAVNALAATTAMNYFSNAAQPTIFALDRQWQPTSGGYPALRQLLADLSSVGMVAGVKLDSAIRQSPAAENSVSYPGSAAANELSPAVIGRIQADLTTLASVQTAFTPAGAVVGTDQTTTAPVDLFADLIKGVQRQASAGFRTNPEAAITSLSAVRTIISQVEAGVWITPPQGKYTLTSNSSPLLVTVRNDLPYTAHMRIRLDPLDATRAGVTIDGSVVHDIPAGRTASILIPATITRSGSFTVRTELTSPDGRLWGAEQTLSLTSTAYGAFTLVMIIVAAVVLVLTSARRIRMRWKDRKLRISQGLQ